MRRRPGPAPPSPGDFHAVVACRLLTQKPQATAFQTDGAAVACGFRSNSFCTTCNRSTTVSDHIRIGVLGLSTRSRLGEVCKRWSLATMPNGCCRGFRRRAADEIRGSVRSSSHERSVRAARLGWKSTRRLCFQATRRARSTPPKLPRQAGTYSLKSQWPARCTKPMGCWPSSSEQRSRHGQLTRSLVAAVATRVATRSGRHDR